MSNHFEDPEVARDPEAAPGAPRPRPPRQAAEPGASGPQRRRPPPGVGRTRCGLGRAPVGTPEAVAPPGPQAALR